MEKAKKEFALHGQTRKGPALAEGGLKGRLRGLAALAVSLCLALALLPAPAAAATAAWDGSTRDTSWYDAGKSSFSLTTPAQLAGLADLVNGGKDFSGVTIALGRDLDLAGKSWTPINNFAGTFDGGGHTIRGLYVNDKDIEKMGLFGAVKGGTVHSLRLQDADVNCDAASHGANFDRLARTGSLAGSLEGGAVYDCWADGGAVRANRGASCGQGDYVGGLVGQITGGTVYNCASSAAVSNGESISDAPNLKAGGIVGQVAGGSVENCYAAGAMNITKGQSPIVGGVAGEITGGAVAYCYWNNGQGAAAGSGTASECYPVTAEQEGRSTALIGDASSRYAGTPSLMTALNNWVADRAGGGYSSWEQRNNKPLLAVFAAAYLDVAGPLDEVQYESASGQVKTDIRLAGQVQKQVTLLSVTVPATIPFIMDVDGEGALTRVLSATGRLTNFSDCPVDVTLTSVTDDAASPLLASAPLYLTPGPEPAGYARTRLEEGQPNLLLARALAKGTAVTLKMEGDAGGTGLGADGDNYSIAITLKVTKAA